MHNRIYNRLTRKTVLIQCSVNMLIYQDVAESVMVVKGKLVTTQNKNQKKVCHTN